MPNNTREKKLEAFGRLLDILDELRVKCPWDRKQTNESLRPNTIEETMELADAIMGDDDEKMRKELGDVLLHIVFYAKIGDEKGKFDIADVCDALCEKLIYRHPHVFGDEKADTHRDRVAQVKRYCTDYGLAHPKNRQKDEHYTFHKDGGKCLLPTIAHH